MFAARRVATRVVAPRVIVNTTQKRTMAGHGAKPEWTGIDKKVRDIFPEDWQLAGAILGGYSSLIILAQIRSAIMGKPAVEVAAPVVAAVATTSGIPDIESPEFETFLGSDAFTQLLDSEDQLAALMKE